MEAEEARMSAESHEMSTMRAYMKELINQNEELKHRIHALETGFAVPEVDLSFSTPNGSDGSKEAARPPESVLKEAARPPESVQKEAARPPESAQKEAARPPESVQKEAARPPASAPKEAARPPEGMSGEAQQPGGERPSAETGAAGFTEKSLEFMCLMMENMKELQRKYQEDREEGGSIRGIEVVRSGAQELPPLPAWSSNQSPLQLSDWLLLIEPVVSDLTATAETWWKTLLKEAEGWYQSHMKMSPLERLQHGHGTPPSLTQEKWQRLERRMSTMMLQAMPEQVREELVSTRRMSVFSIITHLYVIYCPGGISEKQNLLKNLEDPAEVQTLGDAPMALRKWIRWRQRATEIGAITPDPALLVRGLLRMTKKVLETNRELQFRVSLARHGLGIDTVPTLESVTQFAMHLLSECEQLSQMEKKTVPNNAKVEPKVKMMEYEKEDAKGKGKGREKTAEEDRGERQKVVKCKFYLTPEGCRKGRDCKFSHTEKDGKRRCYVCGAEEHLAPACPRKGTGEGSPPKQKGAKVEEGVKTGEVKTGEETKEESETMKGLIEEANKMLRSLTSHSTSSPNSSSASNRDEDSRSEMLSRLQAQLNSLKVFKLGRIGAGLGRGLIDSGATHALRPSREEEDTHKLKEVSVTLADGKSIQLHMSPGGSMITSDQNIEPIVPMGSLIDALGCVVSWSKGALQVQHPIRGLLPVEDCGGCPQIPRKLALELISEIEDCNKGVSLNRLDIEEELGWMRRLLQAHPVLSRLPDWLQKKLVVQPGEWESLPLNRRQRRTLKTEGFALHLYSGEDSGHTLQRSMRCQGSKTRRLLEVDVKKGQAYDMLADEGIYATLLRAALSGKILAVLGGPNCRSRSVLRHRPIEGQPWAPRPVRCWEGGEFGAHWINKKEEKMIQEDDTLLWRMIFLYMISEYVRKAQLRPDPVHFALEQPASPKTYQPAAVSFWDTTEWHDLRKEFQLKEVTFNQGCLGGMATKPTTLGTTFDLCLEDHKMGPLLPAQPVESSKQLERWAPGLMNAVSEAVITQVFKGTPQLRALTYEEHVAFGHVPYRRDCPVCLQSSQQILPHRRNKHPQTGVLALDTCGPLLPSSDVGGWKCRYFLAGAYTYMVPKGTEKMIGQPEEEGGLEEAPVLDLFAEEPEGDDQEADEQPPDGLLPRGAELPEESRLEDSGGEEEKERGDKDQDGQQEAEDGPQSEDKDYEIRVFKMALPLRSKKAREVTRVAMEMVLKLKIDGYHVNRIHSDRGHEFLGSFETWMRSRGILLTRTSGDDPKANGRAEVTVKSVKNQLRRILLHAGVDSSWWPWALRYLNEIYRCQRLDKKPEFPRFLQEVLVRRRRWKKQAFEPMVEVARYLGPAPEDNGHWIKVNDEAPRVTRCYMQKAIERPEEGVWLAIEREVLDALTKRRRLREKTTVRRLKMEEKEEGEDEAVRLAKMRNRFTRMVEEETKAMLDDSPEMITEEIDILAKLKKMLDSQEKGEDDEVLQTKIISLLEVSKNWNDWLPAVDAEVTSLLEEKEAFEEVSGERLEELLKDAEKRGIPVEFLPSKLVCTKKPGKRGGRNKIRWVICGNFEQVKEGENTFSSGADASALRLLIVAASKFQWEAGTIDIKTAFLNATMCPEDQPSLLLVKPPMLLLEKKYMKPGTYYMPKRAVYGLRRSPKLWGDCRDDELEVMKLEVEEEEGQMTSLRLCPLASEPNLWRIEAEESEAESDTQSNFAPLPLKGLLMTYVDDILVTGSRKVVDAVMEKIRTIWTTSEPDQVGEKPIRFLGVEISKTFDVTKNRDVWYVNQQSYIKDLLAQDQEAPDRKIPITKDQSQLPEEEGRTPELIRSAQKATGEMLWLVTRTRLDLMYAVSKMGSCVTKAPQKVLQIYQQIKGYLKSTMDEGICFDAAGAETLMIEAMSDASFAPEGDVSHGAFIIMVASCPVFWRSGRQSFVTLSTAEAEMMEIVESMVAGESIGAIADELFGPLQRKSWTDSQSAQSILTTDGGSWRTRHLRLRASAARSSILQGTWFLQHVAGNQMIADIGTKPLASERIRYLKKEMNLVQVPQPKEHEKKEEKVFEEKGEGVGIQKAAAALKLLTLAAAISAAKGEYEETEKEDQENSTLELKVMMVVFALIIVLLTIVSQHLWKVGVRRLEMSWSNQAGSSSRSLPAGAAAQREEEEKENGGEGMAAVAGQLSQRPTYLPAGGEGMAAVADHTPQRPTYLPPGEGSSSPLEDSTSSSEDTPYRPLDERHIPGFDLDRVMQEIADEETNLYEEAQRNPERFQNYENSEERARAAFQVLTTRYGRVYHYQSQCRYLSSVQTGANRESAWCRICWAITAQTRGPPPPGVPLWIDHWGGDYHVDSRCPRCDPEKMFPACQGCGESAG